MKVKSLTDDDFEDTILNTEGAVLIAFGASWAAQSQAMAALLDRVSEAYSDRVSVFKVDVDDAPAAAASCGVRVVPTLLIFKGELTPTASLEGATPEAKIVAFVDNNL